MNAGYAQLAFLIASLAVFADGRLVGGFSSVDVNDKTVIRFAEKGLTAIKEKTNKNLRLVQIESAEIQMVAGIDYRIRIRVLDGNKVLICPVEVFYQAWLFKQETVTTGDCKPLNWLNNAKMFVENLKLGNIPPSKTDIRNIMGGYETVDPNEGGVLEAALFAVSSMNQQSNSYYANVFLKVLEAKKQIVSGVNYKLKIQYAASMCTNTRENWNARADRCAIKIDQIKACDVNAWDRFWEKPRYQLVNFSCN